MVLVSFFLFLKTIWWANFDPAHLPPLPLPCIALLTQEGGPMRQVVGIMKCIITALDAEGTDYKHD